MTASNNNATNEQRIEKEEKKAEDGAHCEACIPLTPGAKSRCQIGVLLFATFTIMYCGTSAVMLELISTNQNLRKRIWEYGLSVSSSYLVAGIILGVYYWLTTKYVLLRTSRGTTTVVAVIVHFLSASLCLAVSVRNFVYSGYMPLVSIVVLAIMLSSNALLAISIGEKLIKVQNCFSVFLWGLRSTRPTLHAVFALFLVFVYCSGPLCAFLFSISDTLAESLFSGEVILVHLAVYTVLHLALIALFYLFDVYIDNTTINLMLQSAFEYLVVAPSHIQLSARDRILAADIPDTWAHRFTRVCCPWRTSTILRQNSILIIVFIAQTLDSILISSGWTYAIPYTGYMIGAVSLPMNNLANGYDAMNLTMKNVTNTNALVSSYVMYMAVSVLAGAISGVTIALPLSRCLRTYSGLAKMIATITFVSFLASFTLLAPPSDLAKEASLPSSCNFTTTTTTSSSSSSSSDSSDYVGFYGAMGDMQAGISGASAQLGYMGFGLPTGSSSTSSSSTGSSSSSSNGTLSNVSPIVAVYCGVSVLVAASLCREVLIGHAYYRLLPPQSRWTVLFAIKLATSFIGGFAGPLPVGLIFNAMCTPTMVFNETINATVVAPCESLCEKNNLGLNVVMFLFTMLIYLVMFALFTTASCIFDSNLFGSSSQESVLHDGTSAGSSNSLSLAPSNIGTWSKLIHLHDHNLIIEMSNLRAHIEAEQSWSSERTRSSSVSLHDMKSPQPIGTPVGNLDSTDLTEMKRRSLYTVWKGRARSFSIDSKNSTIMRFRVELDNDGTLQKTLVVVEAQVHSSHAERAQPFSDQSMRKDEIDVGVEIDSLDQSEIDGVINEAFSLDSEDDHDDEDSNDNNNNYAKEAE